MNSESEDLSPLLKRWAYEQEQAVRRLKALDGREILQVRLPLGVEQYEIDGRPDGLRPQEAENLVQQHRLAGPGAADDGEHLAAADLELELLVQHLRAEPGTEPLDADRGWLAHAAQTPR